MRHAKYNIRNTKNGPRVTSHQSRINAGSALILAVVLTSLLAIVGVLFVMMARVNQIASSGISESKELDSAIDTVIAKISDELVLDVPHNDPYRPREEYYDYPDVNNAWLASLEPSTDPNRWRQISDIDGTLGNKANDLETGIIDDYQNPSELEDSDTYSADADGDGVADSKWIELADITSSRGRPIYAAIRIVDNGGMLNVNTAYKFDPTDPNAQRIDGSSQMQINLFALSERGTTNTIGQLDDARFGAEPQILDNYIEDLVWRYNEPNGAYTPFDVSDELELRNRFLLEFEHIDTRIEKEVWTSAFTGKYYLHVPVDSGGQKLTEWFYRAQHDVVGPNDIYSYRHIATTYNMDRIIDANGEKMVNINRADANSIYRAIKSALDPNFADVNDVAAQIAVNLIDFRDNDSNVTTFLGDTTYYGFERPCIYISELDYNSVTTGDPPITYRAYAVELYKPYAEDGIDTTGLWQLNVNDVNYDIGPWPANDKEFYVIRKQDPPAELVVDANAIVGGVTTPIFTAGSDIKLQRRVYIPQTGQIKYITVDSRPVPDWLVSSDDGCRSLQRDISKHKCIRRLWAMDANSPTLGQQNNFVHPDANGMQAHPSNEAFTNVGEIGMLFRKGAYYQDPANRDERIGYGTNKTEEEVRVDLAKSEFQQIFNYLTVWPPSEYVSDSNEVRVKGRININTAPWYVIAQLPWVSQRKDGYNTALAEAIVAYRDKLDLSSIFGPDYSNRDANGFETIGQLCDVNDGGNSNFGIDYYARDSVDSTPKDQNDFPDLTPNDEAANDFEERDLIFARISNLVTVRSDVFTAYILVRIGTDGPQKRVIAILDRSNAYSPTDRVKIVAVHPVADPR